MPVISVPDPKRLAGVGSVNYHPGLLTISVAHHDLHCVDVPLQQPSEWKVASPDAVKKSHKRQQLIDAIGIRVVE
ncbi:MAG: hypothetical protein EOP13_00440 [Pseudomonas sp.]|nr:MAG: hypothetical protein EOP13_00440 [Pseudomonas sp.]